MSRLPRIALTGGIACGKSLVAKFLRELGVSVLDADDVVHELESPGGAAVPAIAERFGPSVLAPDGGVDREKLAALVFAAGSSVPRDRHGSAASPLAAADARRDLEAIIHPLVRQRLLDFVSAPVPHSPFPIPHSPLPVPLAIIPLLYESHFESDYDIILCVTSSEDRQIERMVRTRGYTQAQAEARLAAQMPVREKAARADRIIQNDSTPEELKAEVRRCVAWLSEKMG